MKLEILISLHVVFPSTVIGLPVLRQELLSIAACLTLQVCCLQVVAKQTFGWWWLSFPVEEGLKEWISRGPLQPVTLRQPLPAEHCPKPFHKVTEALAADNMARGTISVISIVGSQHCDDLPYRKGGFSNYICTCECFKPNPGGQVLKIRNTSPCSQLCESSTSIGSFAWIAAQRNGPSCSNLLADQ